MRAEYRIAVDEALDLHCGMHSLGEYLVNQARKVWQELAGDSEDYDYQDDAVEIINGKKGLEFLAWFDAEVVKGGDTR